MRFFVAFAPQNDNGFLQNDACAEVSSRLVILNDSEEFFVVYRIAEIFRYTQRDGEAMVVGI